MLNEILNKLKPYNEILFGPFLGEMGWEIKRWSGAIRYYKKQNPNKKIMVASRESSYDLYNGVIDEFIKLPIIKGDYNNFRPNMMKLDFFPKEMYETITNGLKELYPNAYIMEPPNTNNRNVFPLTHQDLNFTPRQMNKTIIIESINREKKIPIVIASRNREDMKVKRTRNWPGQHWFDLFKKIEDSNKFTVFIAGKYPSYIRPPKDYKSFFCLEDMMVSDKLSLIGVTIEAIKNSKLVIGQQSSVPVLSLLLKTPVLSWGDEKKRHQIDENPFGTPCEFIEDMNYNCSAELIYNKIKECLL